MGQRIRDIQSAACFHVFSRGADRQDIYSIDGDQELFESLIGECVDRFGIEVYSYALMSNHFHLIINCPKANLSEAMQFLLGRYAAVYNRRTKRSGPVFGRRFGSVPVTNDAQLWQLARYVHRNPLAFVAPDLLSSYRWSSLPVYLGRRPGPPWLSTGLLSAMIDRDRYLSALLDTQLDDLLPHDELRAQQVTSLGAIEGALAAVLGFQQKPDARSPRRMLAMTLAIELRVAEVVSIAEHFGVAASTVRQSARRGRIRVDNDATFDRLRQRTLQELCSSNMSRLAQSSM